MQAVCDNMTINCDKSVKTVNLEQSVFPEIHINYLHSKSNQNLVNFKQKFRNSFTDCHVVAGRRQFNCKMTQALSSLTNT